MSKNGLYPTGDANTHVSENFPYNVVPQFRTPMRELVDGPKLAPLPDYSIQAIIIKNSELTLTKGWQEKSILSLKNFFVPVENFAEFEILIPPSDVANKSDYSVIDFRNFNKLNKVSYICILPCYENLSDTDQDFWKIILKKEDGTPDSEGWSSVGRIFMLSTFGAEILPFRIKNLTPEELFVKILIGV